MKTRTKLLCHSLAWHSAGSPWKSWQIKQYTMYDKSKTLYLQLLSEEIILDLKNRIP